MATKAKEQTPPEAKDEKEDGADAAPPASKKRGLVGRILGPLGGILRFANPLAILKLPRMLQLAVVGVLVLVIAGGGAGFYFLAGSEQRKPRTTAPTA